MTQTKIMASVAMLKVMERWGIKNIYGYPAGSVNSLMNALDYEKNQINFIQIRHEQVGALAASAHAKLTRQIGATFGSAGPGAVNLLNGLYDAKADHVPVLAIVGQINSADLNHNCFQEFQEEPIFQDVACYDRVAITPQSLPEITNQAIRAAYQNQGVAVIIIPNNLGFIKIKPNLVHSTGIKPEKTRLPINDQETNKFIQILRQANRPVISVGVNNHLNGSLLVKLSEKFQIPVVSSGLAKGKITQNYQAELGIYNWGASKPAKEIKAAADLVIIIGNDPDFDYPNHVVDSAKYIQITNDRQNLGRHHSLILGIIANPNDFINKIIKAKFSVKSRPFFRAAILDKKNWQNYLNQLMTSKQIPLQPAQVYQQINQIANDHAIFAVDTGDNIINGFRYLKLGNQNKIVISAQFATMGISIPGAIAAQLDFPNRQIFSITGDGAFSMVMQDLITERKYHLPIINVITSNQTTNLIKSEQENLSIPTFGIGLINQNFKMIANGMSIKAANATDYQTLSEAFRRAKRITKTGQPFLISVQITSKRGLPAENLRINYHNHNLCETVPNYRSLRDFFNQYSGNNLKSLPRIIRMI